MKLSILVPTYNYGPYIDQCIQSALATESHDIEVILSDDHSTDDTAERVKAYLPDPRFRFIQPPQRLTPQDHHWFAFAHARGQYVYFMGGDDYFLPGAIDRVLPSLPGYPVIIIGGVECFRDGEDSSFVLYNGDIEPFVMREYLRHLNRDELAFAFIPRDVYGEGRGLMGDTLERLLQWIVLMGYSKLPVIAVPGAVLRKRYAKHSSSTNFAKVAYGGSFTQKTINSIYNAFYVAHRRGWRILWPLLTATRRHDCGFWWPGPLWFLACAPLLDIYRVLKRAR